jgi:hypothetical protein
MFPMVLTSKGDESVWISSASSVSNAAAHSHSICALTFNLTVFRRNGFFRSNQSLHGPEMALSSSVVAVSILLHCVAIALTNVWFQGFDEATGPDSTRKRRSKVYSQRSCICSFEVKHIIQALQQNACSQRYQYVSVAQAESLLQG